MRASSLPKISYYSLIFTYVYFNSYYARIILIYINYNFMRINCWIILLDFNVHFVDQYALYKINKQV